MNILQMVPEMYCGGVETGTLDIAVKLKENGHRPFIITGGGRMVRRLDEEGIKYFLLPIHKKSLFLIIVNIFKVRKIIREERIDIVHARSRVPGWIGYFAVKGTQAHFVTTAHGHYRTHFASRVMGFGEKVIVPSYAIFEHMEKDFNVDRNRLRLIPRGVDLSKFRQKQPELEGLKDNFHIAIIGRLTPIKGHVYLIKAIDRVRREIPNVKLFIIGDSSPSKRHYKEELFELVSKLGLGENVVFTGACTDIPEILENIDMVVSASTIPEAFGRVIIEASASCVPVIATRTGGALDIIDDGVTGLLVEPRDDAGMAGAIIKLIKDKNLMEKVVANAFAKVRADFTLDNMFRETLKVYENLMNSKKILIVKLSALGDIVLISPSIRALRKKFPDSKLSILTSPRYSGLFRNCKYIDEIFTYGKEGAGAINNLKLIRELRAKKYDIAVDFQNTLRSHLLIRAAGVKKSVGYRRNLGALLLTGAIASDSKPLDPVSHQFKLLNLLDINLDDPALEFWTSEEDKRTVENFLKKNNINNGERLVAVNPGASPRWETKRWPKERFVELIKELSDKFHATAVLVGGEDNVELKEFFRDNLPVRYIDAIGETSVSQLGELMKRCRLLITGDSAPLHIAAGCSVPFVALFGPTDPKRHMPLVKLGAGVAITKSVQCSPCLKNKCEVFLCMDRITVADVLEKAKDFLN